MKTALSMTKRKILRCATSLCTLPKAVNLQIRLGRRASAEHLFRPLKGSIPIPKTVLSWYAGRNGRCGSIGMMHPAIYCIKFPSPSMDFLRPIAMTSKSFQALIKRYPILRQKSSISRSIITGKISIRIRMSAPVSVMIKAASIRSILKPNATSGKSILHPMRIRKTRAPGFAILRRSTACSA